MELLSQELAGLRAEFEGKIKYDSSRERMIDRLHAELQEYKSDLVLTALRPMALDLIALHDRIGKAAAPAGDTGARSQLLPEVLQSDIEDILYRYGFESFSEPGDRFDARRQRTARAVPTERPELVGTIAARVRKGFAYGERVVRPEMVDVYAHTPSPNR
jgi:molecular chaperone GrpE